MSTLTAPTLLHLLAEIRTILGQPDAANSNWTDVELTQHLNGAIRRYFPIVVQNSEGHFTAQTTLDIIANQETVTLPADWFEVVRLFKKIDNDRIILFYRNHFDESYTVTGGSNPSSFVPDYFFRGNSLVLRPIPEFAETGGLILEYIQFPETLVNGGDAMTSQVSAVFRDVIIWHAIWTAKVSESLRGNGISTFAPAERVLNDKIRVLTALVQERAHSPQAIKPFNEN